MDSSPIARKHRQPNRSWVRPLSDEGGPRYQQIAEQIMTAVRDGVLQQGDRLPPQRQLAQVMGVDLTTVTRAYAEVRLAGLLDAQGAGGTYIASSIREDGVTVDLSMNIPPLLGSPAFARLMRNGLAHLGDQLGHGDLMNYHIGAGARTDREAAALWLEPVLGRIAPDRVLICAGAQSALAALLIARSQPGDRIASEGLTYPGLLACARALQRSVTPVAADQQGMLPEDLDRVCQERQPALIYLNPTIHNPTATTMSAQRRQAIHAVASRHRVPIIEDDPYWLLAGDAPAPLATLGGEAPVFYVSTLSKCLAPGLRTAYLVVPPGEPMEPLLDALRAITLMANPCLVSMASSWIRSGQANEMLQKTRQELGQRQKLAARILPGRPQAHPHGLHLWLDLPPWSDHDRLIRTAQEQGLGVAISSAFSASDTAPDAIRLSLGGATDQATLKMALQTLSEILATGSNPPGRAVVV